MGDHPGLPGPSNKLATGRERSVHTSPHPNPAGRLSWDFRGLSDRIPTDVGGRSADFEPQSARYGDGFEWTTSRRFCSSLGAVIGLISALIPLFGYLADKRRRTTATATADTRTDVPRAMPEHARGAASAAEIPEPVHTPPVDRAAFERARQLVRQPAIFMIVVGALSLAVNLTTAGIGYIDEFVVPLGIKPPRDNPMRGDLAGPSAIVQPSGTPGSDRGTTVLGIIGILFFSLASPVSIWSGYNMLKLRNYWLALAGSVG